MNNNNKIDAGWLLSARRVVSPNHNHRPDNISIDCLVIHNISLPPEQFGGAYIEQFFTNNLPIADHPYFSEIEGLEVSAHLLITRKGDIVQFVAFDERAWHAGQSLFNGQENCNDFSIGVELEGSDHIPYTDHQYQALAEVTQSLMEAYPLITSETIVGHSDIAPGRKTDPGPSFDWPRFFAGLER